jgi:hypothetical protein
MGRGFGAPRLGEQFVAFDAGLKLVGLFARIFRECREASFQRQFLFDEAAAAWRVPFR